MTSATHTGPDVGLDLDTATTYAEWFATLADPTRVRLLHAVASSPSGAVRVGDLATALGISQATCSHHVRRLAELGFVVVDKVGTASLVSVNAACCTGLPHAADVVMGTLTAAGDSGFPVWQIDYLSDVEVNITYGPITSGVTYNLTASADGQVFTQVDSFTAGADAPTNTFTDTSGNLDVELYRLEIPLPLP